MENVISVVLIPEESMRVRIVELSKDLPAGNLIELGEAVLPHMTLAQFVAPVAELENLWRAAGDSVKTLSLTSAGISFVPDYKRHQIWVEIQLLKSSTLQQLHDAICQSDFAKQFAIWSGRGEMYRPHITVGLYDGLQIPSLNLGKYENLLRQDIKLTLAVGQNSHNFIFSKVYFQ